MCGVFVEVPDATEGANGREPVADPAQPGARLGDLEALQGVVKFPVRIKCATLSWNTLAQGLDEIDASSEGAA